MQPDRRRGVALRLQDRVGSLLRTVLVVSNRENAAPARERLRTR